MIKRGVLVLGAIIFLFFVRPVMADTKIIIQEKHESQNTGGNIITGPGTITTGKAKAEVKLSTTPLPKIIKPYRRAFVKIDDQGRKVLIMGLWDKANNTITEVKVLKVFEKVPKA